MTFSPIAWLLAERKYRVRIEGHTDNKPIHNLQLSDNWELSTARASELVRLLITKYGFTPDWLSAAGYAEYHPVANNDSYETRAQNRRLDLVILGRVSPNRVLAGKPAITTGAEEGSIAAAKAKESSAPDRSKPSPATLIRGPTAAQ